eukprot:gene15675-11219_t
MHLLCKDMGSLVLTTMRGDEYEVANRERRDSADDDVSEPVGDDSESLRVQHIRLRILADEDMGDSHLGEAESVASSDGTGVEDDTASLTSVSDIQSDLSSDDWSDRPIPTDHSTV